MKYSLGGQTFSQFFPDEPNFPFSPPPKGRGSLPGIGSPGRVSVSAAMFWLAGPYSCYVLIGWPLQLLLADWLTDNWRNLFDCHLQ